MIKYKFKQMKIIKNKYKIQNLKIKKHIILHFKQLKKWKVSVLNILNLFILSEQQE